MALCLVALLNISEVELQSLKRWVGLQEVIPVLSRDVKKFRGMEWPVLNVI
jgi:hypothetical protein